MSKNNYMGKIDEDYSRTTVPNYDKFAPHFEMLSGSETNEYLHYRYSEAPFGYRPANIDDIPDCQKRIDKVLADKVKEIEGLKKLKFWTNDSRQISNSDNFTKVFLMALDKAIKVIKE